MTHNKSLFQFIITHVLELHPHFFEKNKINNFFSIAIFLQRRFQRSAKDDETGRATSLRFNLTQHTSTRQQFAGKGRIAFSRAHERYIALEGALTRKESVRGTDGGSCAYTPLVFNFKNFAMRSPSLPPVYHQHAIL